MSTILSSSLETFLRRFFALLIAGFVLCAATAPTAQTQTYTVLYSFAGAPDGDHPQAGLVGDTSGNVYGTTLAGGDTNCNQWGCGVIFKLDPSGKETVLHASLKERKCGFDATVIGEKSDFDSYWCQNAKDAASQYSDG